MSIWLKDGVSTFPIKQPMVGQKEFYSTFRDYLKDLKTSPMARIFPLIGKWGVGKSRIAFELVSEALGIDKGWVIRNVQGELESVQLLRPGLEDGILPVYIRYSQMSHDYLLGDNWVGYGAYIALGWLSDKDPVKSIQGSIVKNIHSALQPRGFDPAELGRVLEKNERDVEGLLENPKELDSLVGKGLSYLKKFGIEHLMVIIDEVESETELTRDGLREGDSEEQRKKLDGDAIKVITSAIKHEDSRSRYPAVSFLLLCSPAIGDQIKELEALDRRGEMLEIHNNAYADISDYLEDLKEKGLVPSYPPGLVEAAYTIAGGNFGWFNVLMAYCDQYLLENPEAEAGEVLEDRMTSITRVKEKLIDGTQFGYISISETDPKMPLIRRALLRQLPQPRSDFDADVARTLLGAQQLDGTPLFREFFTVKLEKRILGKHLTENGYKLETDDDFVNDSTGEKFNLEVLLRSLATYSIRAGEGWYVIGRDKDTFLEQVRMLYPKDAVEDAAFILYDLISGLSQPESMVFLGPNFSFLERLNRRYAVRKGLSNYLLEDEADQKLKEHLKELKKDHAGEVKRILKGCTRVLEMDYPSEDFFTVQGTQAVRTTVHNHLFLGTHRECKVDLVWGNQIGNLQDVLTEKKLVENGAHPVIVLSLSAATEDELKKIKAQFELVGRCIIFFHLTSLQKELLEVISVDREYMDIRQSAHQLAPQFQSRLRSIRDEISRRAKEWFQEVDRSGYILRPIVFTKAEEENIPVLAEGFARMLLFAATVDDLGARVGVKFEKTEDYDRFRRALTYTQVGTKLASRGYQGAGIFVIEQDDFHASVPAAAASFLRCLGNSRRTMEDVLHYFFFSAVDAIKQKKIVEQWSSFLQSLGVIKEEGGNYLANVTLTDLEAKLDKVENWLDSDFDNLMLSFKGTIRKSKIDDMFLFKKEFQDKLKQAKKHFENADLQALKNRNDMDKVWRTQLDLLAKFHSLCDYIFDEEKWRKTQFNERELEKIKLEDNDLPVWYRLRHIQLFHDFITRIQEKVSSKIEKRVDEIKKNSRYKGFDMPISPITNALERYKTELNSAKDYQGRSTLPTMVSDIETLAYKLFAADYKQALERLRTILEEVGLSAEDYAWREDSGMAGLYNRSKKRFQELVDGYLDNKSEAEHWLQYFQGAPDGVISSETINKLDTALNHLDIFLNGGLVQEIDDQEVKLQSKPMDFAQYLEKALTDRSGDVTLLLSYLTEVKNRAREYRNELYDQGLKNTVDCIRRNRGKQLVSFELERLPDEETYQKTEKKIAEMMKEIIKEGREFFTSKGAKRATFEFFKEVVEKEAEIDWNAHTEELRELESMGLIKTKVVLC